MKCQWRPQKNTSSVVDMMMKFIIFFAWNTYKLLKGVDTLLAQSQLNAQISRT